MASDELSLLLRLRGENTQLKAVMVDTGQAINRLRQSFGPELTQSVNLANKAFTDIGENITNFVAQRVPVFGGAIISITDGLKDLSGDGADTSNALKHLAESIDAIAEKSGKSVTEVAGFLVKFVQLEGQAERNGAAFNFFGGTIDLIGNKTAKLLPELEKAGKSLVNITQSSTGTASAIARMAPPIAVAVLALAAYTTVLAAAAKATIDLTKHAAAFQGELFDLSQQVGIGVKTLSAFEVLARRTGGELGNITQATVLFQRKLDEAQDPLSKTAEQFRKFNINISDTETALRQAFAALAAMPEGFAQTNAAAEFFGSRGGKQILGILKEANGDIDGTIKRLREMGILISEDAARAADKLNDELAVLELQMRALTALAAEDLIPLLAEIVRALGDLVRAIRPVISILGSVAGVALRPVVSAFKGLSLVVQALTGDYKGLAKAIKEAHDAQIKPISIPPLSPVPLAGAPTPQQAASEAVNQAEAVTAAVKRSAAEQTQALEESFERGRRTREQQANETIAANKRVLEAEKQGIDARLAQKEQEIKALDEAQRNRGEIVRRDTDDYRAITAEIVKLQQERLDKEALFEVTSREIKARAAKERADSIRNQIANETDILISEVDRQIKDIDAQIKRGATVESAGLTLIEQLEQAKIDARVDSLQKQKEVGFLTIQNQEDLTEQLKKLYQERDRLLDEQAARRLQRERATAERERDIQIANVDTLLQLQQIAGERQIETLQALTDLRVITEEEAAKKILKIRLDLVDSEVTATKAKLQAAKSIVDVDERIRTEAELNNQLRVLTEERKFIQTTGNLEIDAGRKADLDNERRYADELEQIRERVQSLQRDTARTVIDLMALHFARRKDIIRAEARADIEAENERNRQAENEIRALRRNVAESNRTKEEKLQATLEINDLEETEAERHRLTLEEIRRRARLDEKEADPLGRLTLDLDNLREFASIIEDSIVPLGQILTSTFQQVADAMGQTVANWVLLGETGPAVMRKILAQALASIAAEAAVNAVKQLALGFATLFFNPAESASHFTAAGLWASIAGGAALAGRGIAGDLFKSKSAGASGGTSTATGTGQLNPLTLERATVQQPQRVVVTVNVKQDKHSIVDVFAEDFQSGGKTREIINNDGVFGG